MPRLQLLKVVIDWPILCITFHAGVRGIGYAISKRSVRTEPTGFAEHLKCSRSNIADHLRLNEFLKKR